MGVGISFWGNENALKLTVVMVAQLCEGTNNCMNYMSIRLLKNLALASHWILKDNLKFLLISFLNISLK